MRNLYKISSSVSGFSATRSVIGMVLILMLLVSCGRNNTDAAYTEKPRPLVGISMCSMLVERWYIDRDILTTELKALGVDVIVQNANNNQEEQNKQIDYLINKDIDVLIIIPVSSTRCSLMVNKAKSHGIDVIAYERLVENAHIDAYYSFDNIRVGQLLAEGLLTKINSGNVMLINGDPEDNNSELYKRGYYNILQPYLTSGDIKVIETVWADNWKKEAAFDSVEGVLSSGARLDGIIAANDSLAEMAIDALSEAGLASKTAVAGQDGDLAAYQRIVEGVQVSTVYKSYQELARSAAQAAYRIIMDKPFLTNEIVNNGWGDIPSYLLEPELVTIDNIDEVIVQRGVHSKEDVYRNINEE